MRVLHLIDSAGVYGAERMLLALAREQRQRGVEVILGSIGLPGSEAKPIENEADAIGLRVVRVSLSTGWSLDNVVKVGRVIRVTNPSLVHCHGYKANVLVASLLRKESRPPVVTTLHGWTASTIFSKDAIYEALDALALLRADHVVFVNRSQADHWRLKVLSKKKCSVIHNGIDGAETSARECRKDDGLLDDFRKHHNVLLGSIGRLSAEKAQHVIIQATKQCREAGLQCGAVIFGEGPERERLESLILDLKLGDHVLLPGYVSDAERHIRCMDVFLLTSLTEGLPMVVLEAIRQGRPVVASRVGGVPEVIEDGETGMLVEPLNVAQTTAAVMTIVSNPLLQRKLVDGAGRRLKALFSIGRMADAYEAVYDRVTVCGAADRDGVDGALG